MNAAAVFRLVLLFVLLPVFMISVRKMGDVPGRALFTWAFYCVCLSAVAAVVEDIALAELLNAVQHLAVGIAAVLALLGVLAQRRTRPVGGKA
jgi:uncharacterized membrane protein YhaH (DUF805 family)